MMNIKILLSALTLALASQYALANEDSAGRKGPPPEAISACEDKSAGDSAEFTGRDGESITGTCKEMHGTLILQPDNMPNKKEGRKGSAS